ncbi:MAG: NUDIX domain-containing protein [Bacteroidales bacterium]|jgi:8-oxo-dGTP pyrophosphatase MutT (NUDIX family)|nr:NUDIX domain-containing protein [Bacteroidales bacterium]MDI9576105.1 NUDIX domain-containing protein [Bacteroidota bacterium]MDD3755504.1 NUDIX domain-containing protein [Bacteroidales bacterium]MDY0401055.1 NUDIX domain-containing protein [Bacteroidales bacterium]HHW59467.1 NUDIX domain-containing protein [Bacteroidales bacterium]
MYKIFIKNKIILITDNIQILKHINEKVLIKYQPDLNEIIDLLKQFADDDLHQQLILINYKLEDFYIKFYNLFKVVLGAGGVVFNEEKDKILFILRNGVWDLPKGKIDYGESDEKAAIREVCEETGVCDLTLVKRLEPTYHIYFSNNEAYLKETHWFSMKAKEGQPLIPQKEEKIEMVKWFTQDDIKNNWDNMYLSIKSLLVENKFFMLDIDSP